jgi:hypothetical protein
MTSYATQILIDYVAYVISNDLYDDSPPDLEALKENPYINLFMNRLDALHTSDFILTEENIQSIVIRFNRDQEERDSDEYNEYMGYEEYIREFLIDHTPPPMFGDDDDVITTIKVDTSSVDALMLAAPTNEAAAAA